MSISVITVKSGIGTPQAFLKRISRNVRVITARLLITVLLMVDLLTRYNRFCSVITKSHTG